ncbi:hypothetical protein C1646_802815 [Rhizophagus diaphanus]|nr:hypothetical protein C1646_802815 [Rhizophagus diaphanus] [Rhizophagus sp. MUCL 43196]
MDLDSSAYYKLGSVRFGNTNFTEYRRIFEALCTLGDRYDHETPEMWCSRIRDPFRKILKKNLGVLSGNGYITMCEKLIERSDRVHRFPSNYIYCSVCDSLVFIANSLSSGDSYRDNHFKRCINGNIISNEHARIKDIFQSINKKEFTIWKYKQFILRKEAEMKRLQLELFSQSTSHSEKDKLASVLYDDGSGLADYKTYLSAKATVAKNTMPSALLPCPRTARFHPEGLDRRRGDTGELFISFQYAKQPKGTMLRLRDGRVLTVV